MDMMKSLLGLEGCKIRFTTPEGEYEGVINRITPEIEIASDINHFEVLAPPETPAPKPELPPPPQYLTTRERSAELFDDFDDMSSIQDSEVCSQICLDDEEFEFQIPPSFRDLPVDNVIIDEINEDFNYAIRHLEQQDEIGMSLESPKIGRHEELHWLCMSTTHCTFLFDINALGKSAFDNGLRDILDEPGILKILHDCREAADCLFHRYNAELRNVFDTQVADFVINQTRLKKDIRIHQYVYPLNSCLSKYLDIPENYLFERRKRTYQDDLVFYGLRPLSHDFRELFTKNVIYLRRLKAELDELLNEPLQQACKVYLDKYQVMSDLGMKLFGYERERYVVPADMLEKKIQVFRFKDHVDIPEVVSSGPPYREIYDPFKQFNEYYEKHNI